MPNILAIGKQRLFFPRLIPRQHPPNPFHSTIPTLASYSLQHPARIDPGKISWTKLVVMDGQAFEMMRYVVVLLLVL